MCADAWKPTGCANDGAGMTVIFDPLPETISASRMSPSSIPAGRTTDREPLDPELLWAAPLGMTVLGALAGLLPAFKAYATDVARNLLPTS